MPRATKKEEQNALRSARSSALKKGLTGPTLIEMSGNPTIRPSEDSQVHRNFPQLDWWDA